MTFLEENWQKLSISVVATILLWQGFVHLSPSKYMSTARPGDYDSRCPLPDVVVIASATDGLSPSSDFASDAALRQQVERLSAAVECPQRALMTMVT